MVQFQTANGITQAAMSAWNAKDLPARSIIQRGGRSLGFAPLPDSREHWLRRRRALSVMMIMGR
jgi:hypothetical protein